eukprot:3757552-Rhodomonas_salina.2
MVELRVKGSKAVSGVVHWIIVKVSAAFRVGAVVAASRRAKGGEEENVGGCGSCSGVAGGSKSHYQSAIGELGEATRCISSGHRE